MKKKITIVDKDLNQLVVVADCSGALYQDRGTKLGEQNLLSDTAVTFKVYDGTTQVAVMMADIFQVPTKQGTMADIWPTSTSPLPDKQLAINYLCARNAERQMLCAKDPKDSVAMVLPITTHLYIDSIKVENAYKRRGIATGMLDFAVSLALPETIGLFCANEDAEMKAMLKALKFAQSPLKAQNMPWKEKFYYYKRLKRLAR
jgi:ribosomal protein S18 acetylase RimI-like enzyme